MEMKNLDKAAVQRHAALQDEAPMPNRCDRKPG